MYRFNFTNKISGKILGLDIRYDAVSAVLVKSDIKGNRIEAHAYVPISNGKDSDNCISSSLKIITEKMDVTGSFCVASFPAELISYRNIQVPFKERKKISQVLPFELETTLPFPVDRLIIDFQTVKKPDNVDHTDIIAAAVEKSRLQSYLDTLGSFNIAPEILTVGGYPVALYMSGVSNIFSENALVVDVGYKNSAVFAFSAGQIYLIRAFSSDLADASGIESLCADIERTLLVFEENFNLNSRPDSVFITGCGLDGRRCEEDMARILGVSVKRTDLVQDSDITIQNYPDDSWNPDRMNNAFALALIEMAGLKGLNFRKGDFALKKQWLEHKKSLIKTGILAGIVLAFVCFNIFLDSYYTGKKLTLLDQQITEIFKTTFPDVKRIVDPLQQMRVKLKEIQKQTGFALETGKNIRAIDILNNISKVIPKEIDVELNRLVIGLENVLVSGETDTFNSVDDIKGRLEQVEYFKNVTISFANMDGDRINFKLKLEL